MQRNNVPVEQAGVNKNDIQRKGGAGVDMVFLLASRESGLHERAFGWESPRRHHEGLHYTTLY